MDITWPFLSWNSLVQLFMILSLLSLPWPHWLFRFWLTFSHLQVDHLPSSVLSLAIFSLCSPLVFIFPPTLSTISFKLMSPKSVFQTVAWVSISHFQLSTGGHIYIYVHSWSSSKAELTFHPTAHRAGLTPPILLDLSDFFNALSSQAWLSIVTFNSSLPSSSHLPIRF